MTLLTRLTHHQRRWKVIAERWRCGLVGRCQLVV